MTETYSGFLSTKKILPEETPYSILILLLVLATFSLRSLGIRLSMARHCLHQFLLFEIIHLLIISVLSSRSAV